MGLEALSNHGLAAVRRVAGLLLLGALQLTTLGQASAQGDSSAGQALYFSNCAVCHGIAPDIAGGARLGAGNPNVIRNAIRGGVTDMAFLEYLVDAEIDSISAYLARELGVNPQATPLPMTACTLSPGINDYWYTPNEGGKAWSLIQDATSKNLFGVEYTYDATGKQLWIILPGVVCESASPVRFSGKIYRTSGPPFFSQPFDSGRVVVTEIGTATFTFTDANNATIDYTVDGIRLVKALILFRF